jgi:uncharacterized OB-fold protein
VASDRWAAAHPPQPLPDVETQGFWDALSAGHLGLCRCRRCSHWIHPPLERCDVCAGPVAFEPASGRGHVYSYTVVHRPVAPGFDGLFPYAVVTVELVEQPALRLNARFEGIGGELPRIGQPVEAHVVAIPHSAFSVPVFRPLPPG